MVKLSGQLICASEKEIQVILDLLPRHMELTNCEKGCIFFSVNQTQNPLIWDVEEIFDTMESFKNHQKRTVCSVWGRETKHIKRQYKIFEE